MRGYFSQIPASLGFAVAEGRLPDKALRIYHFLRLLTVPTNGMTDRPHDQLADFCGVSRRTFYRSLAALREAEYVRTERRSRRRTMTFVLDGPDESEMVLAFWQDSRGATSGTSEPNSGGFRANFPRRSATSGTSNSEKSSETGELESAFYISNTRVKRTTEKGRRAAALPEDEDMADWKDDMRGKIKTTVDEHSKPEAARVDARRAKRRRKVVNAEKPVEQWGPRRFAEYFKAKYAEVYGEKNKAILAMFSAPKAQGQFGTLLRRFQADNGEPAPVGRAHACRQLKKFLDHVFEHRERLTAALRIEGTVSPDWITHSAYFLRLLYDFDGSKTLKAKNLRVEGEAAAGKSSVESATAEDFEF